jgi:hypothetical protein
MRGKVFILATVFLFLGYITYLFIYPSKFQFLTLGSWHIKVYKIEIENEFLLEFFYAFTSYCYAIFMPFYSVFITQEYTMRAVYSWALFWGVVGSSLEILQLKIDSDVMRSIHSLLPDVFYNYVEIRTFDFFDIIFIWIGVLSVFYLWNIIKEDTI